MVHVNGKKVGGNANICKFTAYVSPYFVVSNGGAYTKHIYAASQRIASKLGNEDGFGADPRRVEQAGGKKISDIQKDNIGARFEELGFTYSAPEKEKVEKDSTMDSEAEEKLIFFYHPDHLGSTSYVTDADGNIAQHIEYIPYGEVFVEERNSKFSTNFLFNAKELDNETGLYYYGARYLDPTGAMWLSVDPMWEKYIDANPYNYCHGNPVTMIDPDGRNDEYYSCDGENAELIGYKECETNNIYVVAGKTKDYIKSSMKTHGKYYGKLANDESVLVPQDEKVIAGIKKSMEQTKESTRENGGHASKNGEVLEWEEGPMPQAGYTADDKLFVNSNIIPFKIKGEKRNVDIMEVTVAWHVHGDVKYRDKTYSDDKILAGYGTPSRKDKILASQYGTKNANISWIVVGLRDKKVSFYNGKRILGTITYDSFEQLSKSNKK
jgi:RHS repeat-associated protein